MDQHEVSRYLGLTLKQIEYKVRTRQIPFIKLGRTTRFRKSDIDDWVQEFPALVARKRKPRRRAS